MNENNEIISIIIPVYNVDKYLTSCLNSIINQTLNNLEIILIDDGSTDDSPRICEEFAKKDHRIKVIHKENEGVSVARNLGIKEATGKYIAFIDSDDYIDKNYFETLKSNFKNHELTCSNYIKEKKDKSIIVDNGDIIFDTNKYIQLIIQSKIMGTCWGKLFISEITKKLSFDKNTNYMEDTLFLIDYLKMANIDSIKHYKTYYHYNCINENSITKNKKIDVLKMLKVIFYTIDILDNSTNKKYTKLLDVKKVKVTYRRINLIHNMDELEDIMGNIELPKYHGFKYKIFTFLYRKKKSKIIWFLIKTKRILKNKIKLFIK